MAKDDWKKEPSSQAQRDYLNKILDGKDMCWDDVKRWHDNMPDEMDNLTKGLASGIINLLSAL